MATQFRAFGSQVRSLRTRSGLAELIRGSRQSGTWTVARNPPSLAPGARMTVVKHTPSKTNVAITRVINRPWLNRADLALSQDDLFFQDDHPGGG